MSGDLFRFGVAGVQAGRSFRLSLLGYIGLGF